jgi:glycosyltransferase involved in cell wall biosynthesis
MVQKKLKKIRVAFIISSNPSWLGEQNYFKSLLGTLNDLNKNDKIKFFVFTGTDEIFFTQKNYKNLKIVKSLFLNKKGFTSYLKKLCSIIFKRYDPILFWLLKKFSINIVSHYRPIKGVKNATWFPDFQHVHYPNFFSKKEIISRNKLYLNYINYSDLLIVSSKSSKNDLLKFYKKNQIKNKTKNIKILNFVPEVDFSTIKRKMNLKKYLDISKKYIFIPNQFWIHKNHDCVIEAMKILKDKNQNIQCLFTGNNFDHRSPDHFNMMMSKIKKLKLKKLIKYKGVLPYKEIINLMYYSDIVVNPSFFEGWSTTVEEAKILNKSILLSNIPVHREQNPDKGLYFNPKNPMELARKIKIKIKQISKKEKLASIKSKYEIKKEIFGEKYLSLIKSIN